MGKVEAMKFTRPGDQTFEWIFHEINWDVIELVRAVPPALCVLSVLSPAPKRWAVRPSLRSSHGRWAQARQLQLHSHAARDALARHDLNGSLFQVRCC